MKKLQILIITFLITLSICTLASTQTAKAAVLTVDVSPASWTMDISQTKTLSASAHGGSRNYTSYQWYVGDAVQTGETASSFSYSPVSVGTKLITVTVTDSLNVTSVQSPAASVTVSAALAVSVVPVGPLTMGCLLYTSPSPRD